MKNGFFLMVQEAIHERQFSDGMTRGLIPSSKERNSNWVTGGPLHY